MRRVVVTGLGLVTPLADGVEESWNRILAGQSGADAITGFDTTGLVTTYACEVPLGDGSNGTFCAENYMEPKEQRKVDTFIMFGVAPGSKATPHRPWPPSSGRRSRSGMSLSCSAAPARTLGTRPSLR